MHVNIWFLRYGTKNIGIERKGKLYIIKIKNVYASKEINKMWEGNTKNGRSFYKLYAWWETCIMDIQETITTQ